MGALEEGGDIQASLSHAVGVLLSLMVDNNVPHNVMIAEGGLAVYLVPRKFDLLIEDSRFFTGFDCVCGLVKCKEKATFDGLNYAGYSKFLKEQVAVEDSQFDALREEIVKKFEAEYEGESFL